MVILVDTSALFALVTRDDLNHREAQTLFRQALDEGETLAIHNLILVETVALLHRRQGHESACRIIEESRRLQTIIIDGDLHREVIADFIAGQDRKVSLVDRFSFAVMRRRHIPSALAFDPHFPAAGFALYPAKAGRRK